MATAAPAISFRKRPPAEDHAIIEQRIKQHAADVHQADGQRLSSSAEKQDNVAVRSAGMLPKQLIEVFSRAAIFLRGRSRETGIPSDPKAVSKPPPTRLK